MLIIFSKKNNAIGEPTPQVITSWDTTKGTTFRPEGSHKQGVKILFNPIFLAKSYFVQFFREMSYFILFFGHFVFNFGIL